MTGFEVALIITNMVLLGLFITACVRIESLYRMAEGLVIKGHADCIEQVSDLVAGSHGAYVLRQAAIFWDSPAGQNRLTALGRQYKVDGPTPGAMWLREQAARMEVSGD